MPNKNNEPPPIPRRYEVDQDGRPPHLPQFEVTQESDATYLADEVGTGGLNLDGDRDPGPPAF